MRTIAALAARLPEVGRHVPGLLARRFRVCFEAPTVCADHRAPALHTGEQKLQAERNPVRQHAGACDGQCSAKNVHMLFSTRKTPSAIVSAPRPCIAATVIKI